MNPRMVNAQFFVELAMINTPLKTLRTAAPKVHQPAQAGSRRRSVLLTPIAALLGLPFSVGACNGAEAPSAGTSAGTPAATRLFGDSVGLGVKFSQGQPVSDLPMLLDLRVRWVRDALHWNALETAPGRYAEFSPAFKQQLDFYRGNDIGLVALLTLDNSRAYPGDAATSHDPKAFGRFAVQAARMLRAAGVRFVLEVGNEPHNSELSKAFGGTWNGAPPSPWLQHYVRMVREAVEQVKAFDSSIRLLSDDDMWVLHYRFLEAGLPSALDGFAIHPYTPGPPELTAVAHDTDWTRPFTVVDVDRSFASAVRRLRAQGRAKLASEPSIWITEWGWPVGGSEIKGSVSSETLVAYLPRAFIVAAAAGVEVLCWFSAHDSVDGPMGLLRRDGVRRDSYLAFKALTAQLSDHRLLRQAASAGLQAFVFDGPQGRKLAAWSADGKVRRLPLPAGTPSRVVDALGQAVPTPNGTSTVAIAAAPVYLQADWSDANLDASLAAAA